MVSYHIYSLCIKLLTCNFQLAVPEAPGVFVSLKIVPVAVPREIR